MPFNGSGAYSLPAGSVVADGTTIDAADHNTPLQDIETALSATVLRNGAAAFTSNQSMGNNRLTTLAAGTAGTDAANVRQVQSGAVSQAVTVGGTVDAITLTFSPPFSAYETGMKIRWISGGPNTGAATVNVDSMGAKGLQKNNAQTLAEGDIPPSGGVCEAVYDGTRFLLQNPLTFTGKGADIASAATITIGDGSYFVVTGTTTITGITVTVQKPGRAFTLRFAGALTLTNGASLILPGGANIATAAGDVAEFIAEGGGVVRCVAYGDRLARNMAQNVQTGTTYTPTAGDAGDVVTLNNAAAITCTINNSVFSAGDRADFIQLGAGQVTFAAGAGFTLRSFGSRLKLSGQYSGATIYFLSSSEGVLVGDITT